MPANHFYIPYSGNKRNEYKYVIEHIKPMLFNIKYIVEPFMGSAAISYNLSQDNPLKYEYIFNDNSEHLINLVLLSKDEDKFKQFETDINNILHNIKNKHDYLNIDESLYNGLIKYVIHHKYYTIRAGLYPTDKKPPNECNIKLLDTLFYKNFVKKEKFNITLGDAIPIIENYKDNEEALLIIDPPYLQACNDFYENSNVNIYEYFYYNNINNYKCKILLILEDNWIIKLLFNNNVRSSYNKKYETSKRKTTHLLISNF